MISPEPGWGPVASLPMRGGAAEGTRPWLSLASTPQVSSRKLRVLGRWLFSPSHCYKVGILNEGFVCGEEVLFPEETHQGGPVWTWTWHHEALWRVGQPPGLGVHLLLKDHSLTVSACPVTSQIALKCADICNPCRIWEMSKQWSERVCEEFYRQG